MAAQARGPAAAVAASSHAAVLLLLRPWSPRPPLCNQPRHSSMFLRCTGAGRSRFPGDVPGCEQLALLGVAAPALPPATTGVSQTHIFSAGGFTFFFSHESPCFL